MKLWISQTSNAVGIHDMAQVSVRDSLDISQYNWLKSRESLVLAAHFILLAACQRAQNICHVVGI